MLEDTIKEVIKKGKEFFQATTEKIIDLAVMKCPECKSKEYTSEFLYQNREIPEIPMTDNATVYKNVNLTPLYKYSCNNCGNEWYN